MHPELAELQASYNRLIDDFEAGHISYEEAASTLASMTRVDGGGWVWSIDPSSGSFVRSQPGGPAQVAQPSLYVPAQLPGERPSPLPPGFGQPAAAGPFGQAPAGSIPDWAAQPPQWGNQPSGAQAGWPGDLGSAPGAVPGMPGVPAGSIFDDEEPAGERGRSRRAPKAEKPPRERSAPQLPNLSGLLSGRGRTVLLAIAALVVLALLVATNSSHSASSSGGVPSSPSVTSAPNTIVTSPTTTPTVASSSPDLARMNSVLAAMGTGNLSSVDSVVTGLAPKAALLDAATWAGLSKMGYSITTSPAAASGAGHAVSTISASRGAGAATLTASASWVLRGGQWIMDGWPQLH